ncbi:hypothetical protein DFH11DRAFT_1547664 [Phellopilus nigrolimitatus]|nr:hypothetical protein DFH11DRAFT_1547664 [Phellopilus nigrolimitatus]
MAFATLDTVDGLNTAIKSILNRYMMKVKVTQAATRTWRPTPPGPYVALVATIARDNWHPNARNFYAGLVPDTIRRIVVPESGKEPCEDQVEVLAKFLFKLASEEIEARKNRGEEYGELTEVVSKLPDMHPKLLL